MSLVMPVSLTASSVEYIRLHFKYSLAPNCFIHGFPLGINRLIHTLLIGVREDLARQSCFSRCPLRSQNGALNCLHRDKFSVQVLSNPDGQKPPVSQGGTQANRTETFGRTGVEMEALTAVQVGLLTVYDMVKAVDRGMVITDVRVLEKHGGKSGDWTAPGQVAGTPSK